MNVRYKSQMKGKSGTKTVQGYIKLGKNVDGLQLIIIIIILLANLTLNIFFKINFNVCRVSHTYRKYMIKIDINGI